MLRHIGMLFALACIATQVSACREKGKEQAREAESIGTSYAQCREKAAGDATTLIACSDSAIKQAGALSTDRTKAAAVLEGLSEKAEARLGEDSLAMRVAIADALAKAAIEQGDGKGAADIAARFEARIEALKEVGKPVASAARALGGYVAPSCTAIRNARDADAALAQFGSEFPAALKDEALVETLALDDTQLRTISQYLACLAARTDFGPDVVENSLWLYSSKRHGKRARAILDELSRSTGPDAKAAEEFSAQVTENLETAAGGNG